jgi:hypothetical protein
MATGRGIQLTKQIGEYLVAAELCRRDLLATTFTGNVPHYDIVTSNADGRTVLIQVKTIQSASWQFNIQAFAVVSLNRKKQVFKRKLAPPVRNLICVLVQLSATAQDKFYILRWKDLQHLLANGYKRYLASHGGKRPRKHDSFHCTLESADIKRYRDNWELIQRILK